MCKWIVACRFNRYWNRNRYLGDWTIFQIFDAQPISITNLIRTFSKNHPSSFLKTRHLRHTKRPWIHIILRTDARTRRTPLGLLFFIGRIVVVLTPAFLCVLDCCWRPSQTIFFFLISHIPRLKHPEKSVISLAFRSYWQETTYTEVCYITSQ